MQTRKHLRLIVASPGDVRAERAKLVKAVKLLNTTTALDFGYQVDVLRWERDVYPQLHVGGPQGAIDDAFKFAESDIVVGIFWTRLGTKTADGRTGTEHEIMLAIDSWKAHGSPQLLLFFKTALLTTFPRSRDELEQLSALLDFREGLPKEVLAQEFSLPQEFGTIVTNHLAQWVRDYAKGQLSNGQASLRPQPPQEHAARDWKTLPFAEAALHTFTGLRVDTRDGDVFQDFRVDRRGYLNPNPVSFMWADAYKGNTVSAMIVEADPPELHIAFDNKPRSYPSNVAIRPFEEKALRVLGRTKLCFEARVPDELEEAAGALDTVFLAVRVVNGWSQHWAHGPGNGAYWLIQVQPSWTTISIPLKASGWWRFTSDGNHALGPNEPDFTLLGPVILEFGSDDVGRPGPGRGRVALRNFHLV